MMVRSDTRKSAVALPKQANPLARAIGDRLECIRKERGLDVGTAARQVGLDPKRWRKLEGKMGLPEHDEAQRIARWAFEGVNYWSFPLADERKRQRKLIKKGDGWRTHTFVCPRELDVSMMRTANRLDLTVSAFIQLCVEDFINKGSVVSTYKEAAERIKKARIIERVAEDPYLQSFLSGDLDIAVRAGAKLIDASKAPRVMSHAQQLVERFNADDSEDDWEMID